MTNTKYMMVPAEPTREMIKAGAAAAREYLLETGGNDPAVIYAAMLAAVSTQSIVTVNEQFETWWLTSEAPNGQDYEKDIAKQAWIASALYRRYAAPTHPSPEQSAPAASLGRERPTVPRDIAYLIEQYGNARADNELHPTAYSALIVGLRGWAASLVDRKAIRNAALEEAADLMDMEGMQGYGDSIRALKSQPAQPTLNDSIATGIDQAISEGDGIWRSCTGCHELNEGHDTGPYSDIFKCHLGGGCRECGGIGAIWDDTDYAAMGDAMAKSMEEREAQPSDSQAEPSDTALIDWLEKSDGRFHNLLKITSIVGKGFRAPGSEAFGPSLREAIKVAIRQEKS